jgi:hypothetical protein
MIKFLSKSIFVAMTGILMPVAFVVVCFNLAHVGIVEWADKIWLND